MKSGSLDGATVKSHKSHKLYEYYTMLSENKNFRDLNYNIYQQAVSVVWKLKSFSTFTNCPRTFEGYILY